MAVPAYGELPDIRVHTLDSPEKVADFWEWLTKPGRWYVTIDTETTGLDWAAADFKVRMIQLGDTERGWAIPFQLWRGLVRHALEWMTKARVWMVWHNLGYDGLALRKEGITLDWSIQADTYILAGVSGYCNESRALKDIGDREFGPWATIGQKLLKTGMDNAGWNWATVPFGWAPYPRYGVVDVVLTAMIWEKWQPKFKRWRHMHDLEIAAVRITNNMAWRGMPVDITYIEQKIVQLKQEEHDLSKSMLDNGLTKVTDAEIIRVLEEADAFPPDTLLTAGGKKSVAAEVLDRIDHPAAAMMKRFRWVHRAWNTYLTSILAHTDANGRCHMGIQPMAARTGRMSIEKPPLQQLPSEDPIVRSCVVGSKPGNRIISADYSQIELRLWGSMTGDTALVKEIKRADMPGTPDFFTGLCKVIYGEPDFLKSDHRRTQVKSSVYAKMFDGGIEVAAKTAGVEVYSLVPTWRLLGEKFPSMKDNGMSMVEQREVDGIRVHYAKSPFGRIFAVRGADNEARKVPNFVTQGTAAITLKKAMVMMEASGLDENMILPVHDEILADAEPSEVDEVMHEISDCMNSIIDGNRWGIDVPAVPHHGANWAEAKG